MKRKKIKRKIKCFIVGIIGAIIASTPIYAYADTAYDMVYSNDDGASTGSPVGTPIGDTNYRIWVHPVTFGGIRSDLVVDSGVLNYGEGWPQRYGPNVYADAGKFYLDSTDNRGAGSLINWANHYDSNANEYVGGGDGYTTTNWRRTHCSFQLVYNTRVVVGKTVCPKGNIVYGQQPWGSKASLIAPSAAELSVYNVSYNLNGGKIGNSTTKSADGYRYTYNGFSGDIIDLGPNGENYSGSTVNIFTSMDGITAGTVTIPNYYTCRLTNAKGNFSVPALTRYRGTHEEMVSLYAARDWTWRTDSITAQFFRPAITLPTPTRVGYIFNGWKCSDNNKVYTGSIPQSDQGPQGNFTMTAQWTPITYTIKFNPQGGTVNPTSKSLKYDEAYTFPTPVRSGYKFLGWYR